MSTEPQLLSLHDLKVILLKQFRLWWKHKWIILLISLSGGALGFGYAHLYKSETFTSKTTFSLEQKNQQLNPAQLLLGGAVGSEYNLFSGDNLGILLKSQRILEQALLTPGASNPDSSLLNRWLSYHHGPDLKKDNIEFIRLGNDREQFTRKEDSLIMSVSKNIRETINIESLGGGILELSVKANDEIWALEFSEVLLDAATDLYFDIKVGKSRRNLEVLENRLDSVQRAFNSAMYNAAAEADQSLGIYQSQARIPLAKKEIQTQLLRGMYTELFKTIELTKAEINRDEPVFVIIDAPRFPLDKKGRGRMMYAGLVGIGFGFLSLLIISLQNVAPFRKKIKSL